MSNLSFAIKDAKDRFFRNFLTLHFIAMKNQEKLEKTIKKKITQIKVPIEIDKELTLLKKNIQFEFDKTLLKIKKISNDNYEV